MKIIKKESEEASFELTDVNEELEKILKIVQYEFRDRIKVNKEYGGISPIQCYASQLGQRHNGKIYAESEVGKGTTFTIELPLQSKSVSAQNSVEF